jgi:hypothetical protein
MRCIYKITLLFLILAPIKSFGQNNYAGLETKIDSLQKKVDSILMILTKRKIKTDYRKETKDRLDSVFVNGISITIDSACYKTEFGKITPVIFLTVANNSDKDFAEELETSITLVNNTTNETLATLQSNICRYDMPLIAKTHLKLKLSNSFTFGLSPTIDLQTLNISGKIFLNSSYFFKEVQITNKLLIN